MLRIKNITEFAAALRFIEKMNMDIEILFFTYNPDTIVIFQYSTHNVEFHSTCIAIITFAHIKINPISELSCVNNFSSVVHV